MKVLKKLSIVLLCAVLLVVGALLYQIVKGIADKTANQAAMVKSDDELLGEHFYVPRQDLDPVDVNLYLPDQGESLPVVFNLHGGAFIAGDADTLDSQSLRLCNDWNAVIVTVFPQKFGSVLRFHLSG